MKAMFKAKKTSIVYPLTAQLTQGSTFAGGVAEEYGGCSTYGLIITARCDIEQDKVRTYNYLPIVLLRDWLARDGKLILAERLMADTMGQMKTLLKENNYSGNILEAETPERILEILFPGGDSKAQKTQERFRQFCRQHELANAGLSNTPSQAICVRLASTAPRLKDSILNDLVHQKLAGYYFLDQIEPNGDDSGHVVLLREICLLPKQLARRIIEGVDAKQYSALCTAEPRFRTSLYVGPGGFSMPLGLVSSPLIEHIMQSFAMLFGRIGLSDPDPAYLAGLWERQRSALEEKQ